jgi:L-threonate 2-dehydrogenase
VNQLLCGVHLAVAGEAMALGEKAGVDAKVLLEIVSGSAASSWMLRDRGPRMLMDTPPVTSAVDIFVKDLGIALAAGRSASMALPLAAAAHQMFLAESGSGNGSGDDSQVVAAYRRLNGLS